MNEPKAQQEPSMEEILASIRRIISEDGTQQAADEAEDGPAAAEDAAPPEPEPAPDSTEPAVAEAVEAPEEPEEEDVLELTEVVEEDDADTARAEAALAPPPEPLPASAPPPPPPPSAAASMETGLLSAAAAGSAQAQLSSLVAAVDRAHGGTPIGAGNRTIEDLVKEVMRPMIKDWLDANLPALTERLVRREVERLSRRAEGDD